MTTEIAAEPIAIWQDRQPLMQIQLFEAGDLVDKRFLQEALFRGFPAVLTDQWRTEVNKPPAAAAAGTLVVVCHNLDRRSWDALYESHSCLFWASFANGRVAVDVAGPNREACALALADAKQLVPVAVDAEDGQIPATIWVWRKERGARTLERRLDVPRWPDIASNYSDSTALRAGGAHEHGAAH